MPKRRRGNHEGSVYYRKDRKVWAVSVFMGYDEQGKPRRVTRYVKGKKEDALDLLAELQREARTGTLPEPTRLTVREYLAHWLEDVKRPALRESTFVRYESLVRLHILPYLGRVQLSKVNPSLIQRLYRQLEQAGASARTRRFVHNLLHDAFDQAVRWRYLAQNPCDLVTRPKAESRRMPALRPEEVARLLDAARGDPYEALIVLAVTTGARCGELFGLKWADVDLKTGVMHVRRTLQDVRGQIIIGEPKTAKGRRRVDLPKMAVTALREHRKRLLAAGIASEWVFPNRDGGPQRPKNVLNRYYRPLLRRAGLPPIPFHSLRHTCATLLLLQGVHPRVVQERLGHSTVAITLDTYSDVLPSLQREAADRLDALLGSR